jgi:DNA-binding response OmpR family regulator
MSGFCPHCGHDIEKDQPIVSGDMQFDPRGDVLWQGEKVHLGPSQRMVLHALLKARGKILKRETIALRIGHDGEGDPRRLIDVHICKLKKRMPGLPVETVYGVGLRWAA